MVNVTDSFINKIKKVFKSKDLSLSDYVFCIVCGDILAKELKLDFLIVPIIAFEKEEEKKQLPFDKFSLYRKNGLWLCSDNGAFFHLINSKLSVDKEGNIFILKTKDKTKNSLSSFTGKCLFEHMKNEKLTKKELANNLHMSIGKLNKIFNGNSSSIGLKEIINISREFEGRNKIIKKPFVIIEKIVHL